MDSPGIQEVQQKKNKKNSQISYVLPNNPDF